MYQFILLIITLLTSFYLVNGQSIKQGKWDVSIKSGISTAVGDFNKISPEKVVYQDQNNNRYYFNGFLRDGNSAALDGTYFSAEGSYLIGQHLKLSLQLFTSNNSVKTLEASQSLNDFLPRKSFDNSVTYYYYLTASRYSLLQSSFGIKYIKSFKNISIEVGPSIGIAALQFPDYAFNVDYQFSNGDIITYSDKHTDEKPSSSSLVSGIQIKSIFNISSKFFVGIEGYYSSADFDYSIILRPKGINPFYSTDKITYRTLNLGIVIGIKF